MAYTISIGIGLGSSKSGLTLNAQLVDTTGANVGAAITTGFVETGTGTYLLTLSVPDGQRGALKIYQQGVPATILATCAINPEEAENTNAKTTTRAVAGDAMNLTGAYDAAKTAAQADALTTVDGIADAIKAKTDNLPASPAAVGSAMGLADDAITAAKFDELTAFPLKAADTGATQVARVGADGDTLETLSDQVDGVPAAVWVHATATAFIANITTLVNRLGAFTGTGVNTVLGLFKALLSKAATLPSDVGGTFSPATDSVESLAEAVDAVPAATQSGLATAAALATLDGKMDVVDTNVDTLVARLTAARAAKLDYLTGPVQTLGAGAVSKTITVTAGGSPKDGVEVWVTTDAAGANVVASGTTDTLGQVTIMLDAGTYYVWCQLAGVNFTNPTTVVWS